VAEVVTQEDLIEKNSPPQPTEVGAPHYIDELSWLEFQVAVAREALNRLSEAAKDLVDGSGRREKRVHGMRIAFRRWYSVWSVLSQEGFESKSFKKKLGRKIKRTYKLLGSVRDWDVTLNQAEKFDVPLEIRSKWHDQRDRVATESRAELKKLDVKRLIKKLHKYIDERSNKLVKRNTGETRYNDIARVAIEIYLLRQEVKTQELANRAQSLKDLHNLRLAIKAWRYLLVDFYGHTSEELVEAQQILGQIIDLERMRKLLADEDQTLASDCTNRIVDRQRELIGQLDSMKESLPYGIRPEEDEVLVS